MATLTVSLPDPMTDWIKAQIKAGNYASSSDYVRDLIWRDKDQKSKLTALRNMIDEAEASGVSTRTLDEIFTEARLLNLDVAINEGSADADKGRLVDASEVFDRIEAELATQPDTLNL